MSQPVVNETEIDGGLGVLPAGSRALAIVACASTGAIATPAGYGSPKSVQTDFTDGPLVEAACRHLVVEGQPVVLVRATGTTTGAMGTIVDSTVTGTLQGHITQTASTYPHDDYQVRIKIVTAGTTGTSFSYQYSLDGGRTYSQTQAQGVALVLAISGTGVSFDLTTGKTVLVGDYWSAPTTAPAPNGTDIAAALAALQASTLEFDTVLLFFPIDGTLIGNVNTAMAAFSAAGRPKTWIGSFRIPNEGESESSYKTAFDTAFGSSSTLFGAVCAGAGQHTSAVSGRAYRRPVSIVVGSFEAAVDPQIDIADVNLGAIPDMTLVDANGNNAYHDESINPGLDDSRACVLRTWPDGPQGVYVNRPRILSPAGSDFLLLPMRRVMNVARRAVRSYLIRRLNRPVAVDKKTGYILETAAREIEAGCNAALKAVLAGGPAASGWITALHRNDNLLSTRTMNVDIRIVPLAYVETINETIGFVNPASAA